LARRRRGNSRAWYEGIVDGFQPFGDGGGVFGPTSSSFALPEKVKGYRRSPLPGHAGGLRPAAAGDTKNPSSPAPRSRRLRRTAPAPSNFLSFCRGTSSPRTRPTRRSALDPGVRRGSAPAPGQETFLLVQKSPGPLKDTPSGCARFFDGGRPNSRPSTSHGPDRTGSAR